MHEAFIILAFCGLAYGAVAFFALGSGYTSTSRARRNAANPGSPQARYREAPESKLYSALFWLVTLPVEAPVMALFLAALMALPALLF